jgi:hypothetical protein
LNEAEGIFRKGGVTYVTEQGVTEHVIFDHCCSVNANFVFQGLRVKTRQELSKKKGRGL